MNTLKKVRQLIQKKPLDPGSRTLSTLVAALESDAAFDLGSLYRLPYEEFQLALALLAEWRLDRYYSTQFHLNNLSGHPETMQHTLSVEHA